MAGTPVTCDSGKTYTAPSVIDPPNPKTSPSPPPPPEKETSEDSGRYTPTIPRYPLLYSDIALNFPLPTSSPTPRE